MEASARNALMLDTLKRIPELKEENPELLQQLSQQVAFVPTAAGTLFPPAKLFDPRKEDLRALLDAKTCFPWGPFSEDAVCFQLLCLILSGSHDVDKPRQAPCKDSAPTSLTSLQ